MKKIKPASGFLGTAWNIRKYLCWVPAYINHYNTYC